jgi:peptide/nickel transport system substrate-binding protein
MSQKKGFTRRQVLAGSAALGAAAMMRPRFSSADSGGGILKVRDYSDIEVLDPLNMKSMPDDDVMQCIFNGLVHQKGGDKWDWELDAAKEIKQLDAKHIAFTLRDDIGWTNGFGEMTADDVKYSYERIADPKNESAYHDDWALLDHVEVKDKRSGVIVLKDAFAPLWLSTLPMASGLIMCKAALEKAGGKFTTNPPATSGRYVIKDWQPKQKTILARNPGWKGTPGGFDEIHIFPIDDDKTAELAFQSGDIDWTWVSVSSIERLEKDPPKGAKIVRMPSLAYVWMGMNNEAKPFDNQKVRRAVQLAIDVQGVLDAAYFGAAAPSTGIIAPGLVGHREKNLYGHDVEQAKKLLAEAGYPNGFECTLDILNKQERVNAAQAIQAQLAEIGIKVTIQQHDSGTFWSLGDQKAGNSWKNIQLILDRFSMEPDPSWATAWFTPEQIGVWNWERWNSPEFGELHKKGLVELDPAKRDVMYKKMQDLMEESGSYVFLTHEVTGVLYRDTIVPVMWPNGVPILFKFRKA